MSRGAAHVAGAAGAAAVVLLVAVTDVRATRERPPPAHTGGFGEPTCHACHFMTAENSGGGTLVLEGLPAHYQPGAEYRVEVKLSHPGVAAVGFQLAVRFEDGTQAGTLAVPPAEQGRGDITVQAGVTYAHQLDRGSAPTGAGAGRWSVVWTAPGTGGTVHVHAAAIAADGDSSPLGDSVYTTATTVAPAATR